jgi:hypothetical protein
MFSMFSLFSPLSNPLTMILKLLPTLSPQDRMILLNALKGEEVEPAAAPVEEVLDEEEEHLFYLKLKERDLVSEGEIDIYLKHHTIHGEKLTEDSEGFLRGQLIELLANKGTRF